MADEKPLTSIPRLYVDLDDRCARLGGDAFSDEWADGIRELAATYGLMVRELYEQFGAYLAVRYETGRLSYEMCDCIVNDLWNRRIFGFPDDGGRADLFWDVYLAFDDGEYHRKPDRSDDPELEYTKPQIEKLVRERRLREIVSG